MNFPLNIILSSIFHPFTQNEQKTRDLKSSRRLKSKKSLVKLNQQKSQQQSVLQIIEETGRHEDSKKYVYAFHNFSVPAFIRPSVQRLSILSWNIFYAGQQPPLLPPYSIDSTVEAIRRSGADIACLAEVRAVDPVTQVACGPSNASLLAEALGWYVMDFSDFYEDSFQRTGGKPALWADAILSRYPFSRRTSLGLGASIDVNGRQVYFFALNLHFAPYGPHQIAAHPDRGDYPIVSTAKEAVYWANHAHKDAMAEVALEIATETSSSDPVFVLGDFNEPSHLDWTDAAVAAGQQPFSVPWPSTTMLESLGFVDTYRAAHPNEVTHPGATWTSHPEHNPNEPQDRIDFVFAKAPNLTVLESSILGEKSEMADIVVSPFPSDHRGVVSIVEF